MAGALTVLCVMLAWNFFLCGVSVMLFGLKMLMLPVAVLALVCLITYIIFGNKK
jgi:hypothetical protein